MRQRETSSDPALAGLPAADVECMYAAARAIRDRQPQAAQRNLREVLSRVPHHPEALRLRSILELQSGRPQQAIDSLRDALAHAPGNAQLHSQLGNVHSACGQAEAAIGSWRRALVLDEKLAPAWFNLGRALQAAGDSAAAADALRHAGSLMPDFAPAKVLLGDALLHLGRLDAARTAYRDALARLPGCGDAWRGLANIKTLPFDEGDDARMRDQLARADLADGDRVLIGLALGKLEEDRGMLRPAFEAFAAANALQQRLAPWSRQAFTRYVDRALQLTARLPAPLDPALGHDVIFIVGMPRSGSTLFEQILAAHPQVEGASELPDLGVVIQQESRRRGQPYPDWIAQADAADWRRLGQEYLDRTARWRSQRPRSTDKMPENWKHAGILRAMLPGARVIETRREALETAWSCFKQPFYTQPHFANEFGDLGTCLRGCERAMDAWRARDPQRIHLHRHEDLLGDPEAAIRRLLHDCGLAFDPACLQSHAAERSVRSASAAQVRQPLQRGTARAAAYGAMLDPLRAALGLPQPAAPA